MANRDLTIDGDNPNITSIASDDRWIGVDKSAGTLSEVEHSVLKADILSVPTIADFTNANHDHSSTSEGGLVGGCVLEAGYIGYLSPADSTTYYFGSRIMGGSIATSANTRPYTIRKAGTIYAIDLYLAVDGTLGSAETFTTSFRLNNTTDTTISAVCQMDTAYEKFTATGLSIAIADGDTFEIKMATPAWATNPTNTRALAVIWMK